MSESSESRPDEDYRITYHHQREFEIRRLKMSGDDFQQLFEDIMVRARPGFIRVRPYGNIGDRKCDGLFRNYSIFFQVYSPDELDQAKVQKKIDKDLNGAVAHWGDALKTWVFVYNVRRGLPPDILGTLQEKQKQYPNIKIDHLSNDDLWEITRGLSIEQRNEILGLPLSSTAKTKQTSAYLIHAQEHETNWQDICRKMLPIELDANPLISGDGVTLGIEDILPLDLVEQKERPKPTRDPSPENFQQVLEDQEIPLPYNHFFDHVLTECKSLNQQGKGIAIIGEPGSGKTTLLCTIADWIMKRGELPVFVSLQDLEAGLESYLLEVWLKDAIRKREAPAPLQDDLIEQCNAGRVWLLLDGVDEMAQAQQSLSKLAKEFRGWVGNARMVLTCRVNIWDANRNELRSKFGIYCSRGFRDEDQLIFIKNFFTKAKQPETGNKLIEKLANAPARLKDLIKNPLWITLLCRTWKRQEGKLPATKAALYEGFTKTFYEWKDKPFVSEEKRPLLERALGELAKKAIDQEDFRFRLRETFIRQELDKFDSSFFHIACELGWINKLGRAVENPDEAIYAFLHPTFQEYFAALAIDDWDYFLPRGHEDKLVEGKEYRIFQPQWREVFLLWLGQLEEQFEIQKIELLDKLISFKDDCGEFYKFRAYFLAAIGFAETNNFPNASEIIENLLSCTLDDHRFFNVFAKSARKVLVNTNQYLLSLALVKLLRSKQETKVLANAIEFIAEMRLNAPEIIEELTKLLESTTNGKLRCLAACALEKICPSFQNALGIIIHYLNEENCQYDAARCLGEIGRNNSEIGDALRNCLRTGFITVDPFDNTSYLVVASSLLKINPGDEIAINFLKDLLANSWSHMVKIMIAQILRQNDYVDMNVNNILQNSDPFINKLIETLKDLDIGDFRIGELDSNLINTIIIKLAEILRFCQEKETFESISYCLEIIFSGDRFEIMNEVLFSIPLGFQDRTPEEIQKNSTVLWYCAENMNYSDFFNAWHSSLPVNFE